MNVQSSHNAELIKLRRKFIFTNMLFVVIVLVVVIVAIMASNAQARTSEIYLALEHRVQIEQTDKAAMTGMNAFSSTDSGNTAGDAVSDGTATSTQTAGSDATQTDGTDASASADGTDGVMRVKSGVDQGGQNAAITREGGADQYVATALYRVDSSGNISEISNIVLDIDEGVLTEAVTQALQAKGTTVQSVQTDESGNVVLSEGTYCKGVLRDLNLYYCVKQLPDGGYLVAFASGNYISTMLGSLFGGLFVACLIALVAFFIMSIFLSRWALCPVEEAWNQQRQFVADASHELKTPLTVILANMSILKAKREQSIQSQMRWVESTQAEAQLMQGLVNDMLFLAKSDAEGVQSVGFERVDFSDAVENEALQFEAVAFERGVMIEEDIEPGIFVEGEPARLQRLLGTLLDNACKYVDQNGSIRVSLKRAGHDCRLTVTNSGSVVAKEDLEHLFDRFYRSDKARTREKGGFGLGLSIAQSIVLDHKGTISVTSDAEKGTSFIVKIPTIS